MRCRQLAIQRIEAGPHFIADLFESDCCTGAVAHAAKVRSQHRMAAGREMACGQQELPMAAHAVLRTADQDEHGAAPPRSRGVSGWMQDADQRFAGARNAQHTLAHETSASTLRVRMAAFVTISVEA